MSTDPCLVLPTFAQPLELHTRRCVLRQWKDSDLAPWCAMNARLGMTRDEAGDFDHPRIEAGHRCNAMCCIAIAVPHNARCATSCNPLPLAVGTMHACPAEGRPCVTP